MWPAYSYLPLVSWAIEKDVAEGREHLNLTHWEERSADEKRDLLARIGTMVRNRQMPLPRYVLLHPEARLSDEEIAGDLRLDPGAAACAAKFGKIAGINRSVPESTQAGACATLMAYAGKNRWIQPGNRLFSSRP